LAQTVVNRRGLGRRNGLVVARISRPKTWARSGLGLEAARFRASPGGEVYHPALTYHMLVLFAAPPKELDGLLLAPTRSF
jgi:hypothetical protein